MHGRSSHPIAPDPTRSATEILPARPSIAERPPAPGERTTSPGAMIMTLATRPHGPSGCAVVHLGRAGARVARDCGTRRPEIVSVPRRSRALSPEPYLDRILHAVGDRAPLVIAGLAEERTALEGELLRAGHSPDWFIEDRDLEAEDDALRRRLRALHSHPG